MEKLPNKILIVGGGYIAIEFACLLNNLGVNVTIINRSNQILRGFDREMVDKISQSMTQAGIKIHLDNEISEVSKFNDFYNVMTEKGYSFQVDKILSAIGRSPNTENLDLEKIKVETSKNGAVIINKNYQTSVNNVYALGDVVDRFQLTPVAIHEAMSLVNCLIGSPKQVDYENIPTAVFSTPEFATVGLSEESARKRFRNIEIYVSSFKSLSSSMSKKRDEILLKLIVTKNDQIVRGCHMVGENAAEIIQGFAVALKAGATKQIFDNTVGIHPSTAEEFVTMRSITR
jgi:glutathione reductase (NADPH)